MGHRMYLTSLKVFLMGFVLCWNTHSRAEESPFSMAACLMACAEKTGTLACVSLDDLKNCPKSDIPACKNVSDISKETWASTCQLCAERPKTCGGTPAAPTAAPAPAPSTPPVVTPPVSKPAAKKPKREPTAAEKCASAKPPGVYVKEEVLNEAGQPTGTFQEHCYTLEESHRRTVALEQELRNRPSLTPEQIAELVAMKGAKGLSPEDKKLLEELKEALLTACQKIKERPEFDKDLLVRCVDLANRLNEAEKRANDAYELASTTAQDLRDLKKRIPKDWKKDYRPIALINITMGLHGVRGFRQEPLWTPGLELEYLPHITDDLRLVLVGGIGIGVDHRDNDAVAWGGLGFAWFAFDRPVSATVDECLEAVRFTKPVKRDPKKCYPGVAISDLLVDAYMVVERRFGSEPLNFYGALGGISFLPYATTRTDTFPVFGFGAQAGVGAMRGETPLGTTEWFSAPVGTVRLRAMVGF